jgi:hypothetical protein
VVDGLGIARYTLRYDLNAEEMAALVIRELGGVVTCCLTRRNDI